MAQLTKVIDDYINYYDDERISLNLKNLNPAASEPSLSRLFERFNLSKVLEAVHITLNVQTAFYY